MNPLSALLLSAVCVCFGYWWGRDDAEMARLEAECEASWERVRIKYGIKRWDD